MADVAANEAEQAAAVPSKTTAAPDINNARPAAAILDPHLFMAARRGDSKRLEELLLPRDAGEQRQQGGAVEVTAATAATSATTKAQVIVQVDQPAPAAPATAFSFSRSSAALLDGVTSNEGDFLLHVVAACGGDGEGFLDCAKVIYHARPGLLAARNNRGNTPLHCAAAAGNTGMISFIIALAAADDDEQTTVVELLRTRNNFGETALHQAVRAGSKAAMDELMSVDPELASVPGEGDDGNITSPLYLAISLGKEDVARHLIDKTNGNLSCSGPDGRNVLHAAVTRRQALPMFLELFKDITVDIQQGQGEGDQHFSSVPLLSQLTMQRDKDGSTPLHLAASLDWWFNAWYISGRFQDVWPWSKPTATMLLDANICSAYQPDNNGLYPIHIAALADNLDVTKVLLQKCPDCATLQDGEGRTFLHVAAGGGSRRNWIYKVAHYCCRQPKLSRILNVQDKNGDTALHCAIHVGNLEAFHCLVQNPLVDLNVPNKDDLTPLGLSWSKIPPSFYYKSNSRAIISRTLLLVGAAAGGSRFDLFREKHICEIDEAKKSEDLANTTNAMGIVSVLIATVTFTAAFTLPGGYYQSKSDGGVPGTPILAGSYAFSAFIVADALAFICSCLATISLVFAGMPAMEFSVRYHYIDISSRLLQSSEGSLICCFALGLYLVLSPIDHYMAVMICMITSSGALVIGCKESLRMLFGVNTVRARLGIRGLAAWCDLAPTAGFYELLPFTSLIATFGLPAVIGNGGKRLPIADLVVICFFVTFLAPPYIRWRVKRPKL